MAPHDIGENRTPRFMKIGFFGHCAIWVEVAIVVISFIFLMLLIATFQLMSGIKIDPAKFGLNIETETINR